MRVAWLADDINYIGGAELTQAEFASAAPDGVEVVPVAPDALDVVRDCDRACVFNSVTYPAETISALNDKPVVRYWNDLARHGDPHLRFWLVQNARNVFTSPLHQQHFRPEVITADLIPPPLDLERFRQAARDVSERSGAVSVATWMNPGKAPHLAAEWARGNGGLDFYGGGPYAPDGSAPVSYDQMPDLLARYKTFVYLPSFIEPFGRLIVEAWAAGCTIVTNNQVGARYWIEKNPDALETAAEDFWKVALG